MPRQYLKSLKYGWKLFKCDFNNSINYFKKNNRNNELSITKEFVNNIKQPSVAYSNTSYIYFTNEKIYSNIKRNGVWKFCNLLDGIYYDVYNIIFIDNDIVIFFLNELNPIIIIQCFVYMEIYYIGYIKTRNLFQINHSTSGADRRLPIIEKYFKNIVLSSKINNIVLSVKPKQFIFFGFCGNVGHHLFNEISGLVIFLNNPDNFSKIQGICIGPYDFFNIQYILANKYKFKIIHLNNANSYLQLNIFPIFLNSFILDKNTLVPFFDELLNNNNNKICNKLNTIELCTTNKTLKIVFDIRCLSRILENMENIYIKIIIYIYKTYFQKYNIEIVFTGRFTTNINNIDILIDNEYIQQIKIMNNIIDKVNISDILYECLIGKNILLVMNKIKDLTFSIGIGGTSCCNLMNWVYHTQLLAFCNTSFYTLVQDMQYDCLQNYEATIPPINCVTDTANGNFTINYNIFLPFFINWINNIIK